MPERLAYIHALLGQDDPKELEKEINQLFLDLLDVTQQTDLGYRLGAAYTAFEDYGKPKR